ncbi:helix-loop-helix dna-binding domain containing protein [Ophiostoma piceae UAMH 11346]|uniref:Helix-loop-helix dna-binding domain containing protein n=1 Tax=Ophiostoma piceae (strain UAMH 11346) TaxID=1262450 RepID=S3CUX9_OPHP1|nr:helix-loop-helix dna-binding domain containing protein [Ophiostoma piceae UAMH 11346]
MDSTDLSYDGSFGVSNVRNQASPTISAGYFDSTAWASNANLSSVELPFGTYPQNNECFFMYDNNNAMTWNGHHGDEVSERSSAPQNGIPTPPLSSTRLPPVCTTSAQSIYTMAPAMTTPDTNTSEQTLLEYQHTMPEQTKPAKSAASKVSKSKGKGKGKASAKPRSLSEGEIIAFSPIPSTSASRRTLRTANRKKDDSNEELSPGMSPPVAEQRPETPQQQERIARAKHNDVEREYRNRLNLQYRMLIDTLDESAPRMDGRREKDLSKAEVLELARQRIRTLGDEIEKSSDEIRLLKEQVAGLLNAIQHT